MLSTSTVGLPEEDGGFEKIGEALCVRPDGAGGFGCFVARRRSRTQWIFVYEIATDASLSAICFRLTILF